MLIDSIKKFEDWYDTHSVDSVDYYKDKWFFLRRIIAMICDSDFPDKEILVRRLTNYDFNDCYELLS